MTELFYPNVFTQLDKNGVLPVVYPHASEKLRGEGVAVPIITLSHVTHDKEADKICHEMEFKGRQKFGKTLKYDGRSCGESLRPSTKSEGFFKIPDSETVFPGYYSWWGTYPTEQEGYTTPTEIKKELDAIYVKERYRAMVPDYIKEYPESRYGNHAFICGFKDLIIAYAQARKTETGNVCIRKGGTLRYTFEICYVLIICTDKAKDTEDLNEFKSLPPVSERFNMNGFTNGDGKIDNLDAIPTFHPEYIVSWSKHISEPQQVKGDKYCNEHTAFAFYFPKEKSMKVAQCVERGVQHNSWRCIKTQPTGDYRPWKCPNELT